jgi:Uma2 family endonuclease
MATKALVSIEEYLNTSYTPDVEYVDGELREKPLVGFPHGETQVILGTWFRSHRREWGIKVAVETRTQTSANHVRLPDVVVVSKQERSRGTLEAPPLIAIEVLSPTDTYAELKARAEDLARMGVANVWLIDPEKQTAEVWSGRSWTLVDGPKLQAVDSPMFVDLEWLWAELSEEV